MINLVVIGIEEGERVDVVALALGLRAEGLAGFDRCRAFGEVLCRRGHVGIFQGAQRDSPIGDAAFGVSLQRLFEGAPRSPIPEGVLIEHPTIEKLLCLRITGGLEMDLAELLLLGLRKSGGSAERDKARGNDR